jgi:hypothetical protein
MALWSSDESRIPIIGVFPVVTGRPLFLCATLMLDFIMNSCITHKQAGRKLELPTGPNQANPHGGSTMADLSFTTKSITGAPIATDRFHNIPKTILADIIGDLDCQSKAIEAELKAAKDALKARGQASVTGNRFAITFTASIRQTLDSAAVKAAMGQTWFDDHSRLAEVITTRVIAHKTAQAFAV